MSSSSSDDASVKVWDMADMGFQATAHILGLDESHADAAHDPLSRLATLTGNFPSAAKWITRLPAPQQLKSDVERATRCDDGSCDACLLFAKSRASLLL